jgi:hypothetical protein
MRDYGTEPSRKTKYGFALIYETRWQVAHLIKSFIVRLGCIRIEIAAVAASDGFGDATRAA